MFCPIHKTGVLMKSRFSPQGLALVVKKRATEAGIQDVSCHDFRRTFATTMLNKGADIAIVQKLLGHASLTTTALYDKRGETAKLQAAQLLSMPVGS
jgi:site-specific recombinase XerD